MAVLSWTWTGSVPETLFLRSADGSLSFLASAATFGRYVCEAEEGGVREAVSSYVVRQSPGPRHLQKPGGSSGPEDGFEEIPTVEPAAEDAVTGSEDRKFTTAGRLTEPQTAAGGPEDGPQEELQPTFREDLRSHQPPDTRTYYRELVVVSLLLALALLVLVLGWVHIWRLKKTGFRSDRPVPPEDCSKANTSIQICSLSPPEDPDPEQTILH